MLGAGVCALLLALLCIRFRADQVIAGVVVNILSVALTGFLTSQINTSVLVQGSDIFQLGVSPRWTIPSLSQILVLGAIFTQFYPFEILIVIRLAFHNYLLYKTRFGMHLRAAGDNPHAVDTAGISVAKVRFGAVVLAGMLAGMCYAYSISTNFSPSIYFGAGYLVIAAMIFGNWQLIPWRPA